MNALIKQNVIEVHGMDNALKVAKTLLEQDYQVFVQLDDCDVYIVSYAFNNPNLDGVRFALLEADEEEYVNDYITEKHYRIAKNRVDEHDNPHPAVR